MLSSIHTHTHTYTQIIKHMREGVQNMLVFGPDALRRTYGLFRLQGDEEFNAHAIQRLLTDFSLTITPAQVCVYVCVCMNTRICVYVFMYDVSIRMQYRAFLTDFSLTDLCNKTVLLAMTKHMHVYIHACMTITPAQVCV